MGMHSQSNKWVKLGTYGGKLTENIVQATARDLLCYSMRNVRSARYNIVMHVHDEIVAEVAIDAKRDFNEYISVVSQKPDWAKGCPVKAKGWFGKRYRKD